MQDEGAIGPGAKIHYCKDLIHQESRQMVDIYTTIPHFKTHVQHHADFKRKFGGH